MAHGAAAGEAGTMERGRRDGARQVPPLDAAGLERIALHYVGRYATTRARLAAYLIRKLRARGWAGTAAPEVAALCEAMAAAGYVDDRGFAEARGAALGRRGYGRRRVAQALAGAGIDEADRAGALAQAGETAWDAAMAFARRRRLGPFAAVAADADGARKAVAAMLRAGHDPGVARRIVAASPGETIEPPDR